MTKAELIRALEPFSDDLELAVGMEQAGNQFAGITGASYVVPMDGCAFVALWQAEESIMYDVHEPNFPRDRVVLITGAKR